MTDKYLECFDRDCVQCLAFEEKCSQNCSNYHVVKVKDQDKLPQPNDQDFPLSHCKVRDENDCWFIYTYAVRNNTKEVYVLEKLGNFEFSIPASLLFYLGDPSSL